MCYNYSILSIITCSDLAGEDESTDMGYSSLAAADMSTDDLEEGAIDELCKYLFIQL